MQKIKAFFALLLMRRKDVSYISFPAARFRINCEAPNVKGEHSVDSLTMFTSAPSFSRETVPRCVPVLDGRKECTEKLHEAIRILVMRGARLCDEIERVATDLLHRTLAVQHEAVLALDAQVQLGIARRRSYSSHRTDGQRDRWRGTRCCPWPCRATGPERP